MILQYRHYKNNKNLHICKKSITFASNLRFNTIAIRIINIMCI